MRSVQKRIRHWLAGALDLPQDVLLDMPRITMIGPWQMYIENHRGVLLFAAHELRLLLSHEGQLIVRGEKLVIRQILPEEVLLEGKIEHVQYIDKEGPS